MISFILSLVALVLGYMVYGKFIARTFGPDDRPTPAITKADGVDFMVLPSWKIFMIQFLNIAGTGPIFGASHVLQEILTIKSDDVVGRSKAYEAIVKGDAMPTPGIPESLNVLLHELRGLGLSITLE